MIVYRIEHPRSKHGPWQHQYDAPDGYEDVVFNTLGHANDSKKFPALWKILDTFDIPDNLTCGCESLRHLMMWFPKQSREAMRRHGFRLYAFSAKDIEMVTSNQVVFNRETAIMLSSKTLWSLP